MPNELEQGPQNAPRKPGEHEDYPKVVDLLEALERSVKDAREARRRKVAADEAKEAERERIY